ncbi:sensor domain-containing diguanylate cyclase [Mycobacteroides chelonae]|uniref:GGDEF domain-containing protein n=1 Tax=Mycobacteroides chelonae TaxID=1774 RepID=UPI0012FFCD95|nr:diguanylate cyclase [Mycobacteroides chelonae]
MGAFTGTGGVTSALPLGDLTRWWSSPSRYDQMMGYFSTRSMRVALRAAVGGCAGALALIPLAMEFSPLGPRTGVWRWLDILASLLAFFWMLRWWLGPLPKESESVVFSVTSVASVCIACFADSDRGTGMHGLISLSLMAIYICSFHGARLIVLYLLASLATLTFLAIAIDLQQGWAVAMADSVVTATLLVGVPPIIHFAQLALTSDARAAGIDPLTGLHNRRGFDDQSTTLAQAARAERSELSIIMIDIDRFKQINDRFGHGVGDQVIADVGSHIKAISGSAAVVGRVGGEEFCVALLGPAAQAREVAEQIRAGSESLDGMVTVTVSVGLASCPSPTSNTAPDNLIGQLVADADHAMYSAKRQGGNRLEVWGVTG